MSKSTSKTTFGGDLDEKIEDWSYLVSSSTILKFFLFFFFIISMIIMLIHIYNLCLANFNNMIMENS